MEIPSNGITWWTPKFTNVKFGPEHVISCLKRKMHFIWGFSAHIHDIVGSDWSQIGVATPGNHGSQVSSHFHVLQKIKAVFCWRHFSLQADSRRTSGFFKSFSNNLNTWSNNFYMIQRPNDRMGTLKTTDLATGCTKLVTDKKKTKKKTRCKSWCGEDGRESYILGQ